MGTFDEGILSQLMEIGFPLEGCKRALHQTNNAGLEAATNWCMEHVGDADFSDPFILPGTQANSGKAVADESAVAMLVSMGISQVHAVRCLSETNNNMERAVDWYYSHQEELQDSPTEEQAKDDFTDGNGIYDLQAFISHMGTSTQSGHYVAHILKNGKWVIFNDEKVALSENPPKDLGYIYIYKRAN